MTDMKTNAGFTLIEVLIAVVVLAAGLLGLAALQTTTLSNNQSAYFRSQATQLAYDMSDRMRSNQVGVTAGNYNDAAATADNCEAINCTPAQMAGYDLAQWNGNAVLRLGLGQLPGGTGVVCIDSTPGDGTGTANAAAKACDGFGTNYAIKIWWDDNRSGAPAQGFRTSFRP
jgi:type IV pilus assembly protein PilV